MRSTSFRGLGVGVGGRDLPYFMQPEMLSLSLSLSLCETLGINRYLLFFSKSRGITPWMQLVVQRRGLHSMADMILGRWDHVPAFL